MRIFIQKTLLIIALIALYFLVIGGINYFIYSTEELSFPETSVIITGDSHMRSALNPKYFPNSENISHPGEVYAFSYWKLQRVLTSYQPDTIVLGYAPHNIAKYNDLRFSKEEEAEPTFNQYYPIQRLSELDSRIPVNYMLFYKTLWKQTAFYPKLKHDQYIGKYSNSTTTKSLDTKGVVKGMFPNQSEEESEEGDFSELSIQYLDSIVKLCQSKQITLILVTCPVHKNFLEKIPPPILKRHHSLKEKYGNKAVFFDRLTTQYPDSLYLDANHLNSRGSKLFTKELVEYLNEIKSN